MPYKIVRKKNKYHIVRRDTGKTVGVSASLAKARGSIWHREHGAGEK